MMNINDKVEIVNALNRVSDSLDKMIALAETIFLEYNPEISLSCVSGFYETKINRPEDFSDEKM